MTDPLLDKLAERSDYARRLIQEQHGTASPEPEPERAYEPPEPPPAEETLAQRLLRGRIESAKQGWHQSGPVPFGYVREGHSKTRGRRKLVPCPTRAPILRAIYSRYLQPNESCKSLMAWLETAHPEYKWSLAKIAWILKNRTYLGEVHFGPVGWHKGQHAALVSPNVFDKVQKKLREKRCRPGAQ